MENKKAMCCFCGEYSSLQDLIPISVPLVNMEDLEKADDYAYQNFCAHKYCFTHALNKKMTIHPFFFEETDDGNS